ncbi:MAG: TonB family protein [Parvularculaceae bacterium]
MATKDGTAEILDMADERAKRRGPELVPGDFETAGAFLRALREAAGLDLDEVVNRTHIKHGHLDAIEASNAAGLPARPYAIGFVKAYAEFLGADAVIVIRRFKEDVGYAAPAPVETEKIEAPAARTAGENHDLSLWAVAAVIAFIIWCAFQLTRPPESGPDGAAAHSGAAAIKPAADALEVVEAQILNRVDPVYPRRCEAGARDIETVDVAFTITADGRTAGERAVRASNVCFEQAALNAIKRWRFQPRTVDGAPRPAYDQRYRFRFERPL